MTLLNKNNQSVLPEGGSLESEPETRILEKVICWEHAVGRREQREWEIAGEESQAWVWSLRSSGIDLYPLVGTPCEAGLLRPHSISC